MYVCAYMSVCICVCRCKLRTEEDTESLELHAFVIYIFVMWVLELKPWVRPHDCTAQILNLQATSLAPGDDPSLATANILQWLPATLGFLSL